VDILQCSEVNWASVSGFDGQGLCSFGGVRCGSEHGNRVIDLGSVAGEVGVLQISSVCDDQSIEDLRVGAGAFLPLFERFGRELELKVVVALLKGNSVVDVKGALSVAVGVSVGDHGEQVGAKVRSCHEVAHLLGHNGAWH
jgi:hypothetical protein